MKNNSMEFRELQHRLSDSQSENNRFKNQINILQEKMKIWSTHQNQSPISNLRPHKDKINERTYQSSYNSKNNDRLDFHRLNILEDKMSRYLR